MTGLLRPLAFASLAAAVLITYGVGAQESPPPGDHAEERAERAERAEPAVGRPAGPKRLRVPDLAEVYAETPLTQAVEKALRFLDQSQLGDGSWLCGWGKNTGVISLTVMAFLASGHVPGRGEYGDTIEQAVAFLLDQEKDGMLIRERDTSHGPMYEHGITTLLLGELRGMVDERRPGFERLPRIHRRAVDLVLRAQRSEALSRADVGGWRYTPTSKDSDLSVTGWQLLALRAAQDADLPVPQASIDRAVSYVNRCARSSGGFAYMPARGHEPNVAMTGTGVLALEICGDYGSEAARRGGDWLLKHPLEWKGPFFYYSIYYSTQAMFQLGGAHWERWRPLSHGLLLSKQRPDGSWLSPPDETSVVSQLGPVYTTAMAVLSLTVEFKYLPIYQR